MFTKEQLLREQELMEELKKYDTPSITNVVATYPQNKDLCLGLYHPWNGKWYTDQSLKCMFPELGRQVGYAVTCVYGLPDPNYKRGSNIGDVVKTINASPKPVILVAKQDMPEDIKAKNGLLGGNMMTAFKAAGVVGVISDGPSRDIDEIRQMGVQYMLTGLCAGHGKFELQAINVPVEVCGMQVCPNDIIHMDENGAVKFPREYLEDVLERVKRLSEIESKRQKLLSQTKDGDEIDKIMTGLYD